RPDPVPGGGGRAGARGTAAAHAGIDCARGVACGGRCRAARRYPRLPRISRTPRAGEYAARHRKSDGGQLRGLAVRDSGFELRSLNPESRCPSPDADMKLSTASTVPADRVRVFAALVDPDVLRRCIPGCESL